MKSVNILVIIAIAAAGRLNAQKLNIELGFGFSVLHNSAMNKSLQTFNNDAKLLAVGSNYGFGIGFTNKKGWFYDYNSTFIEFTNKSNTYIKTRLKQSSISLTAGKQFNLKPCVIAPFIGVSLVSSDFSVRQASRVEDSFASVYNTSTGFLNVVGIRQNCMVVAGVKIMENSKNRSHLGLKISINYDLKDIRSSSHDFPEKRFLYLNTSIFYRLEYFGRN